MLPELGTALTPQLAVLAENYKCGMREGGEKVAFILLFHQLHELAKT